jgi:gliding motility-associated-like protein
MKRLAQILIFTLSFFSSKAQYSINGSASLNSCHCYTLTQNVGGQFGAVWNNNRIDLNQSFDFTFQVYLGCVDFNGADGIAFVLQNSSTTIGTTGTGGGSMGYLGISPAVGVTLDTYQNTSPDNDPYYDHIAIQLNGNTDHNNVNTITPLTAISASSDNVEDCQNHTLRIVWNSVTKNMAVYFDNALRVSATNDFVNTVFAGNSLVYWGFTGATGGLSNLQQFCTQLSPSFHFLPNQKKCVNEPITFFDSTISFSNPVTRVWDFGDGSPTVNNVVNPVHTYTVPGNHTVILTVTSLDGCVEMYNQLVFIGTKPNPGFTVQGTCLNLPTIFTDTSHVTVGTINSWYWNLDNMGAAVTTQNLINTYSTPGVKHIKFLIKTLEGCVSDTLFRDITILDRPTAEFNYTDSVCLGTPTSFHDLSSINFGSVNYWQWNYSDSAFPAIIQNPTHIFITPGPHIVSLTTSSSGSSTCAGTSVIHSVFVADKPVAGMKSIIICERQQVQLLDSSYSLDGLAITGCWWDLGNGQFSTQCNPNVTYSTPGPKVIKHIVFNSRGCKSDTITVNIYVADKPIVNFGFSKPLCRDSSLQFFDSSRVQTGVLTQWNWIYNNSTFGNTQNTIGYFPFGNTQVGLSVTSNLGCFSDTVYKTFRLIKQPKINYGYNDTCKYSPVHFSANELPVLIGIDQWHWSFGDGQQANTNNTSHTYTANGQYPISIYCISVEGCSSDTLRDVVNIYGTDAFAGNDTIVAANQPVLLNASGGISYEWSPPFGLNATNVANPIATVTADQTYYLKAYTPGGCESYDTVNIIIYKGPDVYMPTAFTPNGDHLNDILTPFLVGMSKFNNFSIYNRYGQRVFNTTQMHKGWDGRFKGGYQPSGTYVWYIAALDFKGNPVFRKGTVIIIR